MKWRKYKVRHSYRFAQPYSYQRQMLLQFYNSVKFTNARSFSVSSPAKMSTSLRSSQIKTAHPKAG